MIFTHTHLERCMWRGWIRNGQSVEVVWPRSSVGARVLIHSNDDDHGDRMLFLGLGVVGVYIPLGISRLGYMVGDEPSWGFDVAREFGINLHWGERRKHFDWPFRTEVLRWEYETADGWADKRNSWRLPAGPDPKTESHPYRYTLRNGEVQERTATIHRQRWWVGRRFLHRLGWKRLEHMIEVEFSDEVGERSGSWKGGCIGCSYTMRPGERPIDALRRMEAERKF